MYSGIIPDLLSCKDCRQLNQVLKKNGVHGVMFRTMKKQYSIEPHTYELRIFDHADHEYKQIYVGTINECIFALSVF